MKKFALLVVMSFISIGCGSETPTSAPQPNPEANKQANPVKPGGKQPKLNNGKEGD